jgi:hypothetical protein
LPIKRAVHHLPHPLKPPVGAALPFLASRDNKRLTGAHESQFQLCINHILPFFMRTMLRRSVGHPLSKVKYF